MMNNLLDTTQSRSMRPFFVVWTGQAVSLLGSQLVQFAVVWWLAKTTGSATALTMATFVALLPQIILGPFAGALVDRWSRRWVMLAADTAIALATLVLALLFWLQAAPVWSIYALLLVRATGAAFHWPAMQASTTLMVPERHLGRISGLNQALFGLAAIIIPPFGALAVEVLPMGAVLGIDVVSAIPAITALVFIPIPQPPRNATVQAADRPPSLRDEMRQGLRFVAGWKALMMMSLIGILVYMLGRAAGSLSPLLVMRHFQGGALELGTWQSAQGIGAVIGGLILGVWGGSRRRVAAQMLALALDGLLILLIALAPPHAFLLAVAFVFLSGLLETIAVGLSGAIGQAIIPPEIQGRVFSLLGSANLALAPLGLLVAGPVADVYGVPFWWALTGVLVLILGAGAFLFPEVIQIEQRAPRRLAPEIN